MAKTLYMVIEHFNDGDPVPVYRRFRDRGEGHPVVTSAEAAEKIAPRL